MKDNYSTTKSYRKSKRCWYVSSYSIEHPKTSQKLSKTISTHTEKVSQVVSTTKVLLVLYIVTQNGKQLLDERKYAKIAKQSHAYKGYAIS